ncbi:unnamed protein product [Caretta caretta]
MLTSQSVLRKKMSNQTAMIKFFLLGFSDIRELQILIFVVFLPLYLISLLGNLIIITAIALDRHLHNPINVTEFILLGFGDLPELQIHTILRIPSTTGRRKAFSTCSSHLIVVTLFYGTIMIVYTLPKSSNLRALNKVFSVFYTVLTPLANPLIYSLRNREKSD